MIEQKREGEAPIPEDRDYYLTEEQKAELKKMEGSGWELKFIRRPLFQPSIVVLVNPNDDSVGVLESDGTLNMEPDIVIRP
jgi:hypothetical protein